MRGIFHFVNTDKYLAIFIASIIVVYTIEDALRKARKEMTFFEVLRKMYQHYLMCKIPYLASPGD